VIILLAGTILPTLLRENQNLFLLLKQPIMKQLFIALAMLGSTAYAQKADCPSIYADPYTDCKTGFIYLNATPGFDTYDWSPAGSLSNSTIANPYTTVPGSYTVNATSLIGPELVVNGDFSAGNSGFISGQTYSSLFTPCDYYVGPGWFSSVLDPTLPDHTPTTDNMFMSIDGCYSGPTVIWEETMSIANFTTYSFSFWATEGWAAMPNYEIHFIGDVSGDNIVATELGITAPYNGAWVWDRYGVSCWNSGQDNKVTIRIINLETSGYGNDFAMDDFSFRQCCSSSYTVNTPSMAMGPNLFVNGDFSLGNIGFISGQTYSSVFTPCDYFVGPGWFSTVYNPLYPDHTASADNMFMSVDGCYLGPTVIWEETINVTPATIYQFAFWATEGWAALPNYEIHFIGDASGDNIVATELGILAPYNGAWVWDEYGVQCWNSGHDTKVTVRIINLETSGYGNDFAMDDFSFRQCCSEECCQQFAKRGTKTQVAVAANEVLVSPNPNNGSFELMVGDPSADTRVELYNLLGQKIDAFTFSGASYEYVPKVTPAPGIYILHINNGGAQTTRQVIVQ